MAKKHDYDAAWKTILEAFEKEIVELLFPEIYDKINWEIESEALDNELLEIYIILEQWMLKHWIYVV